MNVATDELHTETERWPTAAWRALRIVVWVFAFAIVSTAAVFICARPGDRASWRTWVLVAPLAFGFAVLALAWLATAFRGVIPG